MTSDPESMEDEPRFWSKFAAGTGLAIGVNLLVGLVLVGGTGLAGYVLTATQQGPYPSNTSWMLVFVPITWLSTLGFTQVVYLAPIAGFFWKRDQRPLMQGVIAGAAITFILTGALNSAVVGSTAGLCSATALSGY